MIRLDVSHGLTAGTRHESSADVVRLGRAEGNDLVLPDAHVSGEHARIVFGARGYFICDLRSTHGTAILRGSTHVALDEPIGWEMALETGDVIELGTGAQAVRLTVTIIDEPAPRVLATRRIEDLGAVEPSIEGDATRLRSLYEAQKRIGAASDLDEVIASICDAAFSLVVGATHVTVVLREKDDEEASGASAYVPIVTQTREHSAPAARPIPISRSVFRRVVTERAAIIVADAPQDMLQSESLLGAEIRSILAVPLWKGDDILGVLQLDNRLRADVFSSSDLDISTVLAHHASLAVANARLMQRLRAAEEQLKKENTFLKTREESRRVGKERQEIIGQSSAMRALLEQLAKVVDTRVTVLVEGETGVGKELIAAALHYGSRRRAQLFVTQNCAAIPENLLESELFGHRRGAFTGAHEDKKGLFEIADGGTLFLDEVGELHSALQSKLLRVLQEGQIRPVGATHERRVNVRIVAATNRDLRKAVAEGTFREDLYYRLEAFPLRVPPLRERREDIRPIAEHWLARYRIELGKAVAGFTQQAVDLLEAYDWPGNVRELQNEVQRLVIQIEDGAFVTPEMLSPRVRRIEGVIERVRPTKGTLKEMLDQVERWLLVEALRDHNNNKTATAKTLGITREGLHKKLRSFGL
jgi:transcriptional regulator with GAF, ATPase, and Fis domain